MARVTNIVPWEYRFRVNRVLLDSPVGDLYMRRRSAFEPYRAQSDAQLIVDGFPRSANTYALFAAEDVLGSGNVRGHTHAAATLHRAVKLGVPNLLIIRDPRPTVASLVQLAQGVSVESGFMAYSRFHTRLLSIQESLCIADFEDVVNDFGQVMSKVNEKFGCDLPTYKKTSDSEARIRARIDSSSAARQGGKIREAGVARPSAQRASVDEVLADMSPAATRAAASAERVYSDLRASCE